MGNKVKEKSKKDLTAKNAKIRQEKIKKRKKKNNFTAKNAENQLQPDFVCYDEIIAQSIQFSSSIIST